MGRIQSYNNATVILGNVGYAATAVPDSSTALESIATGATMATIRVVKAAASDASLPVVWYRVDGEDAATDSGLPLFNGDVLEIFMDELQNFRCISADAEHQSLYVEFAIAS